MATNDWPTYLARFHRDQPGITEDVLGAATHGSSTPYTWLAESLGGVEGVVVDVACGSGTLRALRDGAWVGVDMSDAELRRAGLNGAGPLAQGSATALPLRSHSAGAVVCSMALMIMEPLDAVLAEAARIMAPGAVLAATMPADGPLSIADRLRYGLLLVTLRQRRFDYPNQHRLDAPKDLLAQHGFELVSDERRCFRYSLENSPAATTLVRSLYLPGVAPSRIAAAESATRWWRGRDIGVPIRRLVARRTTTM